MRRRRLYELGSHHASVVRSLLENLKYELIPLKNVLDQARYLPAGALVSVTASPAKGMTATVDLALELQQRGFDVIPHMSARLTHDRAELAQHLERLGAAGIQRAFVVGGDADPPGEFPDGLALLQAMEDVGHPFTEIGIPSYPEGHPVIPEATLQQALRDKQPYAAYMTTQMCFAPESIDSWIRVQRSRGIDLPIHIGIPGVAERRKLIAISARIGVGDSVRFLSKNTSLVGKLVRPGGFSPDALIVELAATLADDAADIHGFHVYTFNQVETTERWRHEMLEQLAA